MNRGWKIGLIIGGGIIALAAVISMVWFGMNNAPYYGYRMGGYGMMGGFGGWWMILAMVLFWGLVIWGVVALVRGRHGCCSPQNDKDSALEILRRRYAAGEITKDEFEQKKKDLQ
jgi:putative membrane protein